MKCLVTGGAGFIGSHVAQWLLSAGHEVTVVDDLSGGFEENVPINAHFNQYDCGSPEDMDRLFKYMQFDVVYHLAAYAAEGLSPFIRRHNYINNTVASANLISLAIKYRVRRFVFTSSMAVYGKGSVPFWEGAQPRPVDPYGIAKWATELDLQTALRQHGLQYTIFRPRNVYGPGQNYGDPYRNVVGIFLRHAQAGFPLSIFGDGQQTRAFSYISEVAPIIAGSAFEHTFQNETVNIGGETVFTIQSLAEAVVAAYPGTQIRYLPPRHEVRDAHCSHKQLRFLMEESNMATPPAVSLTEGLARMADWMKTATWVKQTELPEVELHDGLPPYWRTIV